MPELFEASGEASAPWTMNLHLERRVDYLGESVGTAGRTV